MPADDTWPNIGSDLADGNAPHLGSPYLPTRDKLAAQANEQDGDQCQAIENAYRVAIDVYGSLVASWVALHAELTFTIDTVTTGLDAFAEFHMVPRDAGNNVVDVTAWLTPLTKIRWGTAAPYQYAVVTAVSSTGVWCVMPIGYTATAGALVQLAFSSAAIPVGWPTDQQSAAVWQYTFQSPVDANGYANASSPLTVDVSSGTVVNGNRWKSPSSAWALHIPGGPFELSFDLFVELQRTSVGGLNVIGGLSQGGNNQPPGDLDDRKFMGGWPANTPWRDTLHGRARRDLLNNGTAHTWALSLTDGGSSSSFLVRHDARPVVLRARFRFNGG